MCMKWMHLGLVKTIHMIHLENHWPDLDDIWYGCCAIGVYPNIILFSFLQLVVPTCTICNRAIQWRTVIGLWKILNFAIVVLCVMVAAWKKENNLTRIWSYDLMHLSLVCCHRSNVPCDVSVLMYTT
jgi:hypothetical protein